MRPTPWSRGYFARGSLLVGQRSVLNLCCALNALSGSHHWDLLKRSIPARASRAPPPFSFSFLFSGQSRLQARAIVRDRWLSRACIFTSFVLLLKKWTQAPAGQPATAFRRAVQGVMHLELSFGITLQASGGTSVVCLRAISKAKFSKSEQRRMLIMLCCAENSVLKLAKAALLQYLRKIRSGNGVLSFPCKRSTNKSCLTNNGAAKI